MLLYLLLTLPIILHSAIGTKQFLEDIANPLIYNKYVIPKPKESSLDVLVQLHIISLGPVNDNTNSFEISFYYRQLWNDERLKYNTSYGTLELSTRPENFIWTPDIVLSNAKEVTSVYPTSFTSFQPNGDIFFSQRLKASLSCMLDFSVYPFDTQVCSVRQESYAYSQDKLDPSWRENPIQVNAANFPMSPGYDMLEYETVKEINQYGTNKTYVTLILSFTLKRPLLYYLFQTYIPSILLMVMNLGSYWIPENAVPARVALIITTFLSNTIILQKATEMTAKLDLINPMQIFLVVNTMFIVVSLIQFLLVLSAKMAEKPSEQGDDVKPTNTQNNKSYQDDDDVTIYDLDSPKPNYIRQRSIENNRENQKPVKEVKTKSFSKVHIYDRHARVIMPITFICFSLIYWMYYLIFV